MCSKMAVSKIDSYPEFVAMTLKAWLLQTIIDESFPMHAGLFVTEGAHGTSLSVEKLKY